MTTDDFFTAIQKRTLRGAYYLTGPEEYIKERAVRQTCELPGEAARDLNVLLFRAPSVDPAAVIDACESLPFFDDRKVVVVRDLSNDAALPVAEYLDRLPETTILLFVRKGDPKRAIRSSNGSKRPMTTESSSSIPIRRNGSQRF